MAERPFLDYYIKHGLSPVSQDIADLGAHLRRRDALYQMLGLPPGLLAGKKALEFGPGSGHNAIHTLSLNPARYLLVDGNPKGLEDCRRLLTPQRPGLEFVRADFHEFDTEERFDLVICEGFLPLQLDPPALLKRLARYSGPRGLLISTCMDAVSYLPDLVRRAVGQAVADQSLPLREQARQLAALFKPHFLTLKNMSRPVEDWILDNVLHPYFGRLMSMPEAIGALGDEFDVYGASPKFFSDWRWYKDVIGSRSGVNEKARQLYLRLVHNFIDHDVLWPERAGAANRALMEEAGQFAAACFAFQDSHDPALLEQMGGHLKAAAHNLADIGNAARATCQKLLDGAGALEQTARGSKQPDFGTFISLFGRGQQYLSFLRVETHQ